MPPEDTSADVFSPLVEQAIELAAKWHDGTYRKGSWRDPAFEAPPGETVDVPVMAHVTAVATIVQRAKWGEPTVAAAYLHDVIEDANRHGQHLRRAQLREAVGAEVTDIVSGVTELKYDAEGEMRPWRARKEDYLEQIRAGRSEAMAISLADKLHNLWTMNQSLQNGEDIFSPGPNRTPLSEGPDAQLWFHRAVHAAADHHTDPRLDPLQERLKTEIERFKRQTQEA